MLGKVAQAARAPPPGPFERSLEIGAGTGYFSLNLLQSGVVRSAVAHGHLAGMLRTLESNAARLGVTVETTACDAAPLPFPDQAFDVLLGHAILHHLPDLDRAFPEFPRVLRPGGVLLFAGEPSAARRPARGRAQARRAAGRAAVAPRRARPRRHGGRRRRA